MKTTLKAIRACHPCEDGWEKLLKHLGKTKADDEPLDLLTVLESNGLDDALWCLRAVDQKYDKVIIKLACEYALAVAHLWDMPKVVKEYLTTQDESLRHAAWAAARAAWDSAWAAWAAWAARDAAWAARDAAWAARDAAWAAARAAQAAAWDSAWAAARAARAAAWDSAWAAARKEQEALFIKMCKEAGE